MKKLFAQTAGTQMVNLTLTIFQFLQNLTYKAKNILSYLYLAVIYKVYLGEIITCKLIGKQFPILKIILVSKEREHSRGYKFVLGSGNI